MRTKGELPGPIYQPREPAMGPLPTIGSMKRRGMTHFSVHCIALGYCGHQHRFSFEDLNLSDEMVFLDIARLPFRCTRCGACRQVEVAPDWTTTDGQQRGMGGAHGYGP